ncbi:MAG: L-glutamate gamma-semialdehyde dehydrogenase [Polyangiaceae bacterium]|nr:L-glutamate gamma-semialdehyde dehydrogenase [Polyangiaceae bacterium]
MLDLPAPRPLPTNEPTLSYAPGTTERAALKAALARVGDERPDVPHVIGGAHVRDGAPREIRSPHRHARVLGVFHEGGGALAERAIDAALAAAPAWAETPFDERARIFTRAAELAAGPLRQTLNAATMLGQSKTAYQAEIDSACELVDFLRFNVAFATQLVAQPLSTALAHNAVELRPLEGFVLAVTPFNFTAIAGNLPSAPALMGNVVVWKPAETQSLAAYHLARLFEAAGVPPGVINVIYGDGPSVGDACARHPAFAGLHFTGSTRVFQSFFRVVGENISRYRTYPRLVGETGGKDFVLAHPSADVDEVAVALVRGAFEFQGQKCSAASRAYVPRSLWPRLRARLTELTGELVVGDVEDFRALMGAVIDERAYARLTSWQARMNTEPGVERVAGGSASREVGWFVEPTIYRVDDPGHAIFHEELFGPVLAVFVYDDARLDETLDLIDRTSPYALTGAVLSADRAFVATAARRLRNAAGNFYVNDKPTGAVVGQQPFGGARASGTNDKAGSALNLLRWVSPRTVKETWVPPREVAYPSMAER